MARIEIAKLQITERGHEKIWAHRIVFSQVEAILIGRYVAIRNRSERTAPYLLIGRDEQGRCLTAPIVPTGDPLVWRVITAWYCKPSESARLR